MSPATVGEVMTRDVITVEAHTPFQEVVDLLAAGQVSAVPVLEDGRVVGVLSEADLLGELDLDGAQADRPVARTAGEVAAEVMTGPAVTVGAQNSLLAAARLMTARRIKRLPVVDEEGRLVGILSRRDLLRTAARRDAEVREELLAGRGSGDAPEILDRGGLRVLGMDECLDRAGSVPVGRIAFVTDGDPMILPVNHGVDGAAIVFRTTGGPKQFAADRGAAVAFEADRYEVTRRWGWSVVVRGIAEVVEDEEQIERYEQLGIQAWADSVERPVWVRVRAEEISGREIHR
jgi:CBS domain-containing protein/nitroimidazol reductase NimA-like FMN-containing flavoprotein (pyridoxamine 5'-phosphate oxidase superfamily)